MKNLFIAVLLVVGITTFAQEKKQSKGEREKMTSEQKVDLQVKKLTKDLALNESQVKTLRTLIQKQVEKREVKKEEISALKEKKQEERKKLMAEKKSKMENEQADLAQEMKKILTPDQFTKWEKMRAEQKEKMKEKMSERREHKRKKN